MRKFRYPILVLTLMLTVVGCQGKGLEPKPQDKYGSYYEIFVASFYDSDGDGVGDLAGVTEKMSYLNDGKDGEGDDLMVDGLWLMPIMPSPSYHKYDVTDYKAIDPIYGTMADYEELMKASEEAGVKVIIDLVLNHSSVEHPWFKEAVAGLNGEPNRYVSYYHFSKESGLANYHPVPGASGWYYEGVFGPHMPDLNLDSEEVRKEILGMSCFLMEKGTDCFRLDAVTHFYEGNTTKNSAFLAWLKDELVGINPDVYLVGEAWSDAGTVASLYESGIDSFFNFPFSNGKGDIIMSLKKKEGYKLALAIEAWQGVLLEANREAIDGVFLSNHDNARSGGALNRDQILQKMGASIYQLMPGNTFIYYGEEMGMLGSGKDENKRQPLLWSSEDMTGYTTPPANSEDVPKPEFGVYDLLDMEGSLTNHYRKLLTIRRKYPEIPRGRVRAIETENKALCVYTTTWHQGEAVYSSMIVHNLSDETVSLAEPVFEGYTVAERLESQTDPSPQEGLVLNGKSTLLLKKLKE